MPQARQQEIAMRTIRRILVALKEPSAKSLPIVAKAVQLARGLDARLELFHCIDDPIYSDIADPPKQGFQIIEQDWRTGYLKRLESIAIPLRRQGLKVGTSVEWDFPAYEAIVRRASDISADLIVSECHRGRHIVPALLHLTDWELLQVSPLPVLLVKSTRRWDRPVILAAVDPSHAFAKPADLDAEILDAGTAVRAALRGSLHVVYGWVPPPVGAATSKSIDAATVKSVAARARAQAQRQLDRILRTTEIPRSRRHLIERHAIDAIQDAVRATHSSIVVMGAVSRSGLKRIFIGNTAQRLLDALACDILVVKPRQFRARISRNARGARLIATHSLGL
jgi:universal stress protein E